MQPIARLLLRLGDLGTGLAGLITARSGNKGQCGPHGILPVSPSRRTPLGDTSKSRPRIEDIVRQSFEPGAGGKLTLTAAVGDVEVKAVEANAVTVEIVRRVDAADQAEAARLLENLIVEAAQQDRDVTVGARFRPDTTDDERRRISLHFQISVPRRYNLDVSTVGFFRAGDLQGDLQVETAGGAITLGHVEGAVVATSSGGEINLARVDGEAIVNSAGGRLTVGQLAGPLKAHTAGGCVSIEDAAGALEAETGGGSFKAYFSRQPPAASSIHTAGGRIEISLAQSVGVELDAAATNGRVISDYAEAAGPKSKRNALQVSINGGGPTLILRSSDGHIYLKSRPPAGPK